MTYVLMADAAFAANIPPGFEIVAGYYGGPNAYHVWSASEWKRFPGYKLPIWVGGQEGAREGAQAVTVLKALRVPSGAITALDMETRKDITYVEHFAGVLGKSDYKVWVYGSESTVFQNPPVNGYWVADYTSDMHVIDYIMTQGHVRAVQYSSNPGWDSSLVKQWTEGEMWHG